VKDRHNGTRAQRRGQLAGSCPAAGRGIRRVRAASIASVMILMTSLLLGRVHPFGDPGLFAAKRTPVPIVEHSSVPPEVRSTLVAKCADCHSMQTEAPSMADLRPSPG
jgi:cytochrome c